MSRFKGLQGSRHELLFLHEVSLLSRFLLGALQIHFNIIVVFIFFSIIPILPQYIIVVFIFFSIIPLYWIAEWLLDQVEGSFLSDVQDGNDYHFGRIWGYYIGVI